MTAYQGSVTARICAWARAYYSKNENHPGFNDYLAEKLISFDRNILTSLILKKGRQNRGFLKEQVIGLILPIPVLRSIFAEREFFAFKKEQKKAQYLILGAGLDTFAWRDTSEDITFFEVDHPLFQKIKQHRIRELNLKKQVHFVPVDFNTDSLAQRLNRAGFDSGLPTFVTVMGLSYYLSFETFMSTLETISALGSKTAILFDFYERAQPKDTDGRFYELKKLTSTLGEPMSEGYEPSAVISSLEKMGFEVTHHSPQQIRSEFLNEHSRRIRAYSNIHFIKAVKN